MGRHLPQFRGQIGLRMNAFPDPLTMLTARPGRVYLTTLEAV